MPQDKLSVVVVRDKVALGNRVFVNLLKILDSFRIVLGKLILNLNINDPQYCNKFIVLQQLDDPLMGLTGRVCTKKFIDRNVYIVEALYDQEICEGMLGLVEFVVMRENSPQVF